MALRKIAVLGNPVLRQFAAPVVRSEIGTPRVQTLIQDMIETMFEYDGRGLAAPQIHESLRIVVMLWDFNPKESARAVCLINPEIRTLTQETSSYWEGCLSLPGLRGLVSRPNRISVKALNEKGKAVEYTTEGFCATVVQHEYDHLEGKLYVDRMSDFSKLSFEREFQKYLAGPNEKGRTEPA